MSDNVDKYEYDLAFSLLACDEKLASEINDLLSNRYKTFLYSERQKDIAGADGELKFKEVFAEKSRMVIVLYREGWGQTPWTRMEEEAIRGRAYDQGYDFVKFIPLDIPPIVPKYLPKTQLWINALRYGAHGAASVIEARLEELGVITKEETAINRAERLKRKLDFDKNRKLFLNSPEGVRAALSAFEDLDTSIKNKIEQISSSNINLAVKHKREHSSIVVIGGKNGLKITWSQTYSNTVEHSDLRVELWNNHPPLPSITFWKDPIRLKQLKYEFDLLPYGSFGWVNPKDSKVMFSSESLADHLLKFYLDNFGT